MNIGILGWDGEEHESVHLGTVAAELGHTPFLFTLDDVGWAPIGDDVGVVVGDRPAAELDVIVSRAQLRTPMWQPDLERLSLLSSLPTTPILDPAGEFVTAESKLLAIQRLRANGIPVPPTVRCASADEIAAACRAWGDIVVKPSFGWGGTDVERLHSPEAAFGPVATGLLGTYGSLLAQPFVPHPDGDQRLTVVGDEVAFSFRRVPPSDGWKANVAQGARVEPCDPPEDLRRMAVAAARIMGITIAGLDVVRHNGGYLVFEINNVPGWYPLAADEQFEAAAAIIRYAEWVARG